MVRIMSHMKKAELSTGESIVIAIIALSFLALVVYIIYTKVFSIFK